jgi:hypothetical protein
MTTGMFPDRARVSPKADVLRVDRVVRARYVPHTDCQRLGFELGFRQQTAAPAADYDAWLASVFSDKGANRKVDGSKLRRAVIMRRNGCTIAEASRVVGICKSGLCQWLNALPPELAV